MVFKTTYVDRRISLREGAFFFTRMTLFLPLNKRNTRDKAKGLCISSERYIVELGRRYLSTLLWREFAQSMIGALYIAKRLATFVRVITLPP